MRYTLGEQGARKWRMLTAQRANTSSKSGALPMHAIDNIYPYPFEVRWTESQISGGGYEIWLPPKCLQVDGTNISPEKWIPYVGGDGGKINPNISDDWWYRLNDKVASSGNVDELSSFNLYLNSGVDEVLMTLSAEEAWKGSNGFVHIAEINNYRSKPNVKSNLILDNTRQRPFDLVEDPSYTGPCHQWIMQNCVFEDRGKTIALTGGFLVPAPSVTPETSSTFYGLRLVQVDNGDWLVDRVEMRNTSDFTALNALSIGQQLSQPVSSNEVVAIYPLYIQGTAGGIIFDLRDAWYNIGVDSADEKSVALTGDTLSSSIEQLSSEYHLNHFHDRENDLSVGQILSGSNPPVWMVDDYDLLVRHRGQTNPNGEYANELHYLCLQDLVDNLSSGTSSGGNQDEIEPDQLSSIPVAGMFAWTESTKTIGPGGCMVGRQWYTCTNGIGSGKLDGLYQLKVSMNPSNATLMVVSDAPLGKAPTANQNYAETWIPIYQIVDGKIAADYRGAFVVPAYE